MGSPKTARDTRGVFPLSRVRIDQNASKPVPGRRLSNHVEWRIFITSQNILGDLQTRGFAQPTVLGMVRADTPPSRAEYQKCLYSQTLPPLKRPQSQIFSIWRSPSRLHICNCRGTSPSNPNPRFARAHLALDATVGTCSISYPNRSRFKVRTALIASTMACLISKRRPRREWRQIAQELAREMDSEEFWKLSQELLRALDELKFDA